MYILICILCIEQLKNEAPCKLQITWFCGGLYTSNPGRRSKVGTSTSTATVKTAKKPTAELASADLVTNIYMFMGIDVDGITCNIFI